MNTSCARAVAAKSFESSMSSDGAPTPPIVEEFREALHNQEASFARMKSRTRGMICSRHLRPLKMP
jgi:hypothetical protein